MIAIPGLNPIGPPLTPQELLAPAGIGGVVDTTNTVMPPPPPPEAPPFIRQADLRPHLMKVLGKANFNYIITSKPAGVPGTDSMTPHFGNFRHQPRGLLSGADPHTTPTGPLMPRPDSNLGFRNTRIKNMD